MIDIPRFIDFRRRFSKERGGGIPRRCFISPRFTRERELPESEKYRYNERPIGFLRFLRRVSCPFLAATLEYRINASTHRKKTPGSLFFDFSTPRFLSGQAGRGGERGGRREGGGGERGKKFSFVCSRLFPRVSKPVWNGKRFERIGSSLYIILLIIVNFLFLFIRFESCTIFVYSDI